MEVHQDIFEPPIIIGIYQQIEAPVYTDSTHATLDDNLAAYQITWVLKGLKGIALITESTAKGTIAANSPSLGTILITIPQIDTASISPGEYEHECTALDVTEGIVRGLFKGHARVVD
jgi:hypothetical protein